MSVFQNLLIGETSPPMTLKSGATSEGNSGAGAGLHDGIIGDPILTSPILTGDVVGASILTIVMCGLAVIGSAWMINE
jgi:hypothetical protein